MDVSYLGRNPISEDKPAGDDARHSEEFEALQRQIELLSVASQDGQSIDWKRVRSLGEAILSQQSKNIFVAAYLAASLQETDGLPGLAEGAGLMRDLTANFWDSMYPPSKRLRGRMNAYAWWKERALAFLKNFQADEAQDKSLVDGLSEAVEDLDHMLAEKSQDAPVLRDVLRQIQAIPVESPEEDTQQTEQPSENETNGGAAEQAAAPEQGKTESPSEASSKESSDAEELFRQGLESLSQYGDWLFQQDPGDPLALRVKRWTAWSRVSGLPPADGATTRLPPPEKEIIQSLEQLLSQSKFEQALREAESRVTQYLFWLDLSHVSARALQGLGRNRDVALAAVEAETLLFWRRLPGIEELTFSDGTPFCSQGTRHWLYSLVQGDSSQEQDKAEADSVEEVIAEAGKRAADRDVIGALGVLDSSLRADGRVRNRYRLQVGMLKILARTGNIQLSEAYVQNVVASIDRHNLEEWEPHLALDGLKAAYDALRQSEDSGVQEQVRTLFSRMGRISPADALRSATPSG